MRRVAKKRNDLSQVFVERICIVQVHEIKQWLDYADANPPTQGPQ